MVSIRAIRAVTTFLVLALVVLLLACSDRASTDVSGHSQSAARGRVESLVVPPVPAGLVSADAGPALPALPYAAAIAVPPWTICTVSPEGDSGDPAHMDQVIAATDGLARFYPPPPDWGSRLNLVCTLNGSAQGQFLIDLNDNSTFTKLAGPDLAARKTGVRPALTGDLSATAEDALSQGGYPPRPDSAGSSQYANWVQKVTQPMDIYSGVGVARIGYHGTGSYEGTIPPTTNSPWSGFVQSASGFVSSTVVYYGTFYQEYELDTWAPPTASCSGNCNTLLWGGIGGYATDFAGATIYGNLVQSGFNIVGNGIANVQLYYEYWPSFGTHVFNPPSGDAFAFADQFTIWGWSAGANNCTHSTNGAWACFWFEDDTNHWVVASPTPLQKTNTTTPWYPSTVEYIAEESSWANAYYWFDTAGMEAWDFSGTLHNDPSNGTDPYVVVTTPSGTSGQVLNIPEWDNGSVNSPASPMWLIWNESN